VLNKKEFKKNVIHGPKLLSVLREDGDNYLSKSQSGIGGALVKAGTAKRWVS
jgi:hypothetical protein